MKPLPFPFPLNIGTDVVHLPRVARLLTRQKGYLERFSRRILCEQEQNDFRTRFKLTSSAFDTLNTSPHMVSAEMTRWLAGRFAAKEAARKAAPTGAAYTGWKEILVRVEEQDPSAGSSRPEIVYLDDKGGRVGKLSISHDGEYVVATVLAAS
ncbi:hypothetical protein ASPZODRAFT_66603 [Penicilliopsis zonata CBS 506.65]|uniref:4'-phosphopantetheinyl transferase domain-containing protein n=1 Tax=Penicilliopsis zonata CBS 506.65 TaxID=1073090 RepID=A0A1L9SH48_9EURO|nr:hypothetical protein ASPZODRAFT_66603 [Penicilliopsis zonata CBS 506.65]OJJ46394.1 hypothetical protein ASPZODRAFT_66603 [Penicilliopsis zonata CBS 506.65]